MSEHDRKRPGVHLSTTQGGVLYAITTSRYPITALAYSNTNYSERLNTVSRLVLRCIRCLGLWQEVHGYFSTQSQITHASRVFSRDSRQRGLIRLCLERLIRA